jgi:hypothetical protein
MDFDDIVVQMQVGTVTAFAAFADALIKSGAMDPKALIASLQRPSHAATDTGVGPLGRALLDSLVEAVELLSKPPRLS